MKLKRWGQLLFSKSLGKKGEDAALPLIVKLIIGFIALLAAGAFYLLLTKQANPLLDKFLNLF
ncbi:MAG: hypothetical protein AABW48_05600 [Nanoarchaeota archaeon]|mgnify:FL=1